MELLAEKSKNLRSRSVSIQAEKISYGGDDAIVTGLQRDKLDKCR